jgi:hypothetical protein
VSRPLRRGLAAALILLFAGSQAAVALAVLAASPAAAQWSASRADSHAPIGVMGDHRHEAGEVMLSYRFMYMNMEGSRDGSDAIDDSEIVSSSGYGFMVTPEKMTMSMHCSASCSHRRTASRSWACCR